MPSITQNAWSALAAEFDLDLITQYGSSLMRPESARDLDLGLEGAVEPMLPHLIERFCHGLERGDLDLCWLPNAGWLLPWEATREGRPVFERRPGYFSEYRNAACLQWMEGRKVWGDRQRRYLRAQCQEGEAVNRELVLRKSVQIAESLRQLEETLPPTVDEFAQSHVLHHAAERLLELLVEDAAALNTEIASAVAGIPPSDYYSSFFALAQSGWISRELAGSLAIYASVRNTLVHRYERIDLSVLYGQLSASIPMWRAYLDELEKRL